ncbi:MAG: thermonuclease family protein [Candidatus Woesebacteria bacterium]|jgi:micrococcal nuclease
MREIIANILAVAFLAGIVLFVLTLKNPNRRFNQALFKTGDKKKLVGRYIVVLLVLFFGIGIATPSKTAQPEAVTSSQQQEQPTEDKTQLSDLYDVIEVVDGDTIKVNIDGKTETLRLIGIDTPETVDPGKPVQCYGKEASDNAKSLLTGKKVRLESDDTQEDRDKYDRLLRYVYFEDGTMYNKQVVADGYAHEYTYSTAYKYQSDFKQAQSDADAANKGFWSPNTCNGDTEQAVKQEDSAANVEAVTETQTTAPANTTTSEAPQNTTTPVTSESTSVYYADCTAAREAGVVPIYSGQPGYSSKLDRDGDGIACE